MSSDSHKILSELIKPDRLEFICKASGKYLEPSLISQTELSTDLIDRYKEWFKRNLTPLYPLLVHIIGPVYIGNRIGRYLKDNPPSQLVTLNLGSGATNFSGVIAVDRLNLDNVNVVCNLDSLPFADNAVERIISIAVLEHVKNPELQVSEMKRILAPGGRIFCFIPFMQPYHASPHDYQRYTEAGIIELFSDFELIKVDPLGPTSSLIWVLQEWLALFFSFGSSKIYRVLVPLFWVLSPLKLLDVVMQYHPQAKVLASGFFIEVRKR